MSARGSITPVALVVVAIAFAIALHLVQLGGAAGTRVHAATVAEAVALAGAQSLARGESTDAAWRVSVALGRRNGVQVIASRVQANRVDVQVAVDSWAGTARARAAAEVVNDP